MQSNTEIKYIDSNGNNCSPLPIIETTITDPNSLPLETGIYVNETGFSVYLGSSATSTTNVKMIEQRVNVHNSSTYTLTYIHQTTYDQSSSVYIRAGSLYLNAGSTSGTTTFATAWFNKILDSTGSIAKQVGLTTVGSPTKPIYLAGGYPTAFSSTVGSSTKPIYMSSGTLTECSLPYSNENLLINPDFKINQRGGTTYTYSGTASYTVDRWTFDSASYTSSTLTPNTGSGMTLYNAISSVHIVQYIEKPLELSTQYTISANSPTGTVKATFTTPSALPTSTINYVRLLVSGSSGTTVGQLNVRYHATKGYWCVRIATEVGETLTLNWVKLEKGAIATPFVTPEPTTELLKCQRYYYQTKTGNNYGVLSPVGWMQSTTQFRVLYELPTTLMKEPTVLINGNVTVSFGSGTTKLTVTSTGKQHWHGDKQVLIITTSQGTKDATGCYLQANNDTTAHIAFDAEI